MSGGSLTADFTVPLVGALMCSAPVATRPTVPFGVRVPRERAGAPVIRRERRAYYWRTAAISVSCTGLRAGQGGSRLNGNVRGLAPAAGTDRDDDRFWKAGLLYVNRDDPAIVVGARFGAGLTLNAGNPAAWLVIAGIFAAPAGLAVIGVAAGM